MMKNINNSVGFTLFALPKAFKGSTGIIQRNAIESWKKLSPRPEIILFGKDDGVAQIAAEFGLRHIEDVGVNQFGTPLVSDLFLRAQCATANNLLCYINSDIILMDDFMPAVAKCSESLNEFLMVGQRWNTKITELINYENPNWQDELRQFAVQTGYLHPVIGIDYFVFTRGLWQAIPPFAIGHGSWDNWLVGKPIEDGKAVVDATESVFIVHQDHAYIPYKGRDGQNDMNSRLMANVKHGLTSHSSWQVMPYGLKMRNVGELLYSNYPDTSAAIQYIDYAYKQNPNLISQQYQHYTDNTLPSSVAEILIHARQHLNRGTAAGAARMIMESPLRWPQAIVEYLFKKGVKLLHAGKYSDAVIYLYEATTKQISLPQMYYVLAVALAKAGSISEARKACQIELQLQPGHAETIALLREIESIGNVVRS